MVGAKDGACWAGGWNPTRDLFYYFISEGSTTNRAYRLYQYDPVRQRLDEIGLSDGRLHPSPDGKWIVWETPSTDLAELGEMWVSVSHLHAYCIETREDYTLTDGVSIERFMGWSRW
jgi:hypothetical protein